MIFKGQWLIMFDAREQLTNDKKNAIHQNKSYYIQTK